MSTADATINITTSTVEEPESLHNYNNALWVLLPLLFLWWLPLILFAFANLFTPRHRPSPVATGVGTAAVTGSATAGAVAGAATATSFGHRFLDGMRSWARPARDAFITLGVLLLLALFVYGGITEGIWIATWIAFSAFLLTFLVSWSVHPNWLFRLASLFGILAFAGSALYILIKTLTDLPDRFGDVQYVVYK